MRLNAAILILAGALFAEAAMANELPLRDWRLQSSEKVSEGGEVLSTPGYGAEGWYAARVPSTLLAALVDNGVYPDPYYGDNLTRIPGYREGRWLVMPSDSPFHPSWWYRTEFTVPEELAGKRLVLHLEGVNYRANVWLNGERIADDGQVVGMFRRFAFPLDERVKTDGPNALAIEVTGPGHIEDKEYRTKQIEATTGWDDHNPQPPDLNTGLWQDVYITATGPVDLEHPYVSTALERPAYDAARLTVSVDAVNRTDAEQTVVVRGTIEGATFESEPVKFRSEVTLAPGETRRVVFSPEEHEVLNFENPRLWWPMYMGIADLYDLTLAAEADGVSDREEVRFGVREAETYINDEGWRGYRINGQDVLIRGGAWMTADMLLRLDPRRYDALIRYAREAGLNMLRSEGFSIRETDDFYALCDHYGVMVTQQIFGRSIPDEDLAVDCIRDMLLRIRNHPSLVHFLGHDETFPTESLDQAYRDLIAELTPERSYQPHSGAFDVEERFQTGGTRTGTRELWTYAGPAHYYTHRDDGAWGFAQSGGIGGVFAPLDSLRRTLPEDALWPPKNPAWSLHTVIQGVEFFDEVFAALGRRYGEAKDIEELIRKGTVMNYESARGMFEAYGRNKYDATGITTWKYDAAWPAALTWHYVDWHLQPTGAYYGAKKACEPLHVQYSYDDHSIWVVNGRNVTHRGLRVRARIFNLDMTEKGEREETIEIGPDGKVRAFVIDRPEGLTKTHFLRLDLMDRSGRILSDNFYWLSTEPDVPGEVSEGWENFHTRPKSTMDFTALDTLPEVELEIQGRIRDGRDYAFVDLTRSGGVFREGAAPEGPQVKDVIDRREQNVVVTLTNPSDSLAFYVRAAVTRGDGGTEVAPIFWTDNHISLLPGETRTLEGTFYASDLGDAAPKIKVEGWNVPPAVVSP